MREEIKEALTHNGADASIDFHTPTVHSGRRSSNGTLGPSGSENSIHTGLLIHSKIAAETLLIDGRINSTNTAACLPNSGAITRSGSLNRMQFIQGLVEAVLTLV